MVAPANQLGEALLLPFRHHLHPPIGEVAHEPFEAQAMGEASDMGAEEHPLHSAGYEDVCAFHRVFCPPPLRAILPYPLTWGKGAGLTACPLGLDFPWPVQGGRLAVSCIQNPLYVEPMGLPRGRMGEGSPRGAEAMTVEPPATHTGEPR